MVLELVSFLLLPPESAGLQVWPPRLAGRWSWQDLGMREPGAWLPTCSPISREQSLKALGKARLHSSGLLHEETQAQLHPSPPSRPRKPLFWLSVPWNRQLLPAMALGCRFANVFSYSPGSGSCTCPGPSELSGMFSQITRNIMSSFLSAPRLETWPVAIGRSEFP